MVTPDLAERVQLLHADLNRVRRKGQYFGSGATIHRLINQVSTAQAALGLVETRYSEAGRDKIELLLALAEECLCTARKLLAQTSHMPSSGALPPWSTRGEGSSKVGRPR